MSISKNTDTFAFTNPNPKGLVRVGDCVFRAISIATGRDWLTVFDDLTAIGREASSPANDKLAYEPYLDKVSKRINVKVSTPDGIKRLTGRQLAEAHPTKTYVVRTAGHLLAVKNGKVRDTWDSGNKSAYIIWEVL